MEVCEVLIVGGGPAGSSCAWMLRRAGIDVVVMDKNQFPRNKVCAGWITPPVMDELEMSADEYRPHGILQPITRFLTGMIDGTEIETNYGKIVSYGIRRIEFDDFLLRRSGASLRLGQPFHSLRRDAMEWVVNEQVRASVIVGAGGHFCPVARWSHAPRDGNREAPPDEQDDQPIVVAQEIEFQMTESQRRVCRVLPDRPELFFCRDLKGYGWVFRKDDFLNIGLGREGESQLSTHVAAFVQFLKDRHKISHDISERFHGHAYRLRTILPQSAPEPNLILIGDAAGLADRQSGEGIRPAIESGLLAAHCVIEARKCGYDDLSLRYAESLRARFDVASPSTFLDRIPAPVLHFAAGCLMRSHLFTRRVLLDQWFLHAGQPPFAA
jgi:menaquinone-9 beta-reductase